MTNPKLNPERARSLLFVPATRPERIDKALACGPDVVIVDLEDAVAPGDKPAARAALLAWLEAHPAVQVAVRINGVGTPWREDDLAACRHAGVAAVMLPKAETAGQIDSAQQASGKGVLPIIETAAGMASVREIALAPATIRLIFGKLDLAVELDLVPDEADEEELVFLPYRAMLVLASHGARRPAPIDGVFTGIKDEDALARYAARARRHGFGGMLLIHPAQVAVANTAFTPSEADIAWARAVIAAAEAAGGGAAALDGRMIDAPVIARAQRILGAGGSA